MVRRRRSIADRSSAAGWGVCHSHDRTGGRGPEYRNIDDRRELREGAQNGVELGGSKGGRGRLIERTKGEINSKLHVSVDAKGRPIRMFLSAGLTPDYVDARALLHSIPHATALLGDRGYDAEWFCDAIVNMESFPCIPSRRGRK